MARTMLKERVTEMVVASSCCSAMVRKYCSSTLIRPIVHSNPVHNKSVRSIGLKVPNTYKATEPKNTIEAANQNTTTAAGVDLSLRRLIKVIEEVTAATIASTWPKNK